MSTLPVPLQPVTALELTLNVPVRTMPAIAEYFDGSPVPSFAIDADHVINQ